MKYDEHEIVYPDGDRQTVGHSLRVNQIVDLNGNPLRLPLPDSKIIAYRVYRKSTRETRNEVITEYHLELVPVLELREFEA